jgi:hypothetical protein
LDAIEDELPLAALKGLLAAHACDLNRLFARAFADMLLGKMRSSRDIGRALKAQNQCRIALRLLVALDAAEQAAKKSRNRTNKLMETENRHHDQDVGQRLAESHLCAAQARTQELAPPTHRPMPQQPFSHKKGRGSHRAPFDLPLERLSGASPCAARACSHPSSA